MLLYGHDEEVKQWAGKQLESVFEPWAKAIGVVKNGKIVAGIVYHNYRPGYNIEMSVASIDRWMTREVLRAGFLYPFHTLNLPRVTSVTGRNDKSVRSFLENLGFMKEGILRNGHPDGDAVIYGLLKEECRFLEVSYGKEKRKRTSGT